MTILAELQTDPAGLGYAPLLAVNNDQGVADLLNEMSFTAPAPRLITARGILSDYSGGPAAAAAVLDKLAAAAPGVSALNWAFGFLKTDGLDIGHPATQGMIDQLAAGNVITTTEATNLKALALKPISRAGIVLGRQVTANDVARTVRDDFGASLLGA
jgi:hypothetical protein